MTPTPKVLSLSSLTPGSALPSDSALQGQIVSICPYSTSTGSSSLVLAQSHESLKVQLELRGAWAQSAAEQLALYVGRGALKVGPCDGESARVEIIPVKSDAAAELPIAQRMKVVFDRGIRGWLQDGEPSTLCKEFQHQADAAGVPAKRRTRPDAHSLSSDEGEAAVCASNPQRATTSKRGLPTVTTVPTPKVGKLVVPVGNPDSPWVGLAPGDVSASTPSTMRQSTSPPKSSTTHRGASSEPKTKRVRESRDIRTTWGFSSPLTNYVYVALDTLVGRKNSGGINVIAMAVVSRPLAQMASGTKDWACILQLYDPTTAATKFVAEVRYYGKHERDIPSIQDGDILVIQGLNWSKDRKVLTAYVGKGSYSVLPTAKLLTGAQVSAFAPPPSRAASLTDAEVAYARELARWARKHALLEDVLGRLAAQSGIAPVQAQVGTGAKARSAVHNRGGGKGRKLVTVSEVCADTFCDVQGEIVKFYKPFGGSVGRHDACNLFVTDYTTNSQLYDYTDTSEVRTPGQIALQVSVFGAQNDPLLGLAENKLVGRLVYLRNVRPKLTSNDFLEATMVEDEKYPERRDVTLLRENDTTSEWLTAFQARRTAYWASLAGLDSANIGVTGTKREGVAPVGSTPDRLSLVSNTEGLALHSISSALAHGIAGTYRFRARVIDFYPARLEDWVRAYCPICGEELSARETACLEHNRVEHEWRFMLAIADEADENDTRDGQVLHVFVPVAGQEGSTLFPDFDSSLLSALRFGDSTALSALTSRLHGILGTLVETKRRKEPVLFAHAGPAWDAVLECRKVVEGQLRWHFAQGRVSFR